MPPRRPVPALQHFCSREVARQVVEVLVHRERQLAGLKTPHPTPRLHLPPQGVPGPLQAAIHTASLDLYRERYEATEEGLRVWVLTRGVLAPDLYTRLQATPDTTTFNWTSKQAEQQEVTIPVLCSLLHTMITPTLTVLSFKQLSLLNSVGQNVFDEFKKFLQLAIPHLPRLRSLTLCSHNSRNSLPQCDNEHLKLLGLHCQELDYLDVSFNKAVTGEGVRALVGCQNLAKLLIFDCAVFEKEVAKVLPLLPKLTYLGYKETGKAVKSVHRAVEEGSAEFAPLLLTHVDNMGSKARRLIASTLRCKKPVCLAISLLCPMVTNIKVRVADDDCHQLAGLERLEAVELVYHVGSLGSPGPGTAALLAARGHNLTSIAIKCNSLTMSMLVTVAETCPGLAQLWARCNHLLAPWEEEEGVARAHQHLANLHTLYLRVGETELSVSTLPSYVLHYLLRNTGPRLRELILAVRSHVITDHYLCSLLADCSLTGLEKVLVVVPGLNSIPGILHLHTLTLQTLLHTCPNLRKVGNLLSWSIQPEEVEEAVATARDMNWDIEIMHTKMTMR